MCVHAFVSLVCGFGWVCLPSAYCLVVSRLRGSGCVAVGRAGGLCYIAVLV